MNFYYNYAIINNIILGAVAMKKYLLLLLLLFNTNISYAQKATQRWGISSAWLVQNAPFREFASFQLNRIWYAQGIDTWDIGEASSGIAVGFSYDVTAKNGLMFRIQGIVESTGWISGVFDIGTGVRVPMSLKNSFFSIEAYFSINQTGGTLHRIGSGEKTIPDSIDFYMGLFGFKTRLAFEFPIGQKFFITPYVSYAVYPWLKSSTKADLILNGFSKGSLIDSLQIGFEFGSKF